MSWPKNEPYRWGELIRTISSVISTLCLIVIAAGLVSASVYTLNIVHVLEHNHGTIGSLLNDGEKALESAHNLLQSSQLDPIMVDFHNLVSAMLQLSEEMAAMDMESMLQESEAWRNMSSSTMVKMAKAVLEL